MDHPVFSVNQLNAHLQALRKSRGLTQAGLGALLGVKQSRIADIERDPGSISVAQLHRLLAALGAQMVLRDKSAGWALGASAPAVSTGPKTPPRGQVTAGATASAEPGPTLVGGIKKPKGTW